MAKNFFKRYIWLVDLLSRRGYIPLKEIIHIPEHVRSAGDVEIVHL